MNEDKKLLKKLRKIYKEDLKSVDATEEQLEFLLQNYLDEDSIIGIHNTFISYESFFEIGLYNKTSMDEESEELSNTVMYNDRFCSLMKYPNGDGEKRGKTAIILKIPKKVFMQEQGIFETLKNGIYGIPPQFIVGAFQDGKVIQNEEYNVNYESPSAIKCEDIVTMQDKKIHAQIFKETYDKKRNNIMNKILNYIKKIGSKKTKDLMLPEGEKSHRNNMQGNLKYLSESAPSLEEQKENAEKFRKKQQLEEREEKKTRNLEEKDFCD